MEKQVVVEEPLEPEGCCGAGCCKPGCCLPCVTCCSKCCLPCVTCCSKCCLPCVTCCSKCCLPSCCKCPSCPGCGCLSRALCFVPRLLCYLPRKLLSCHKLKCLLLVLVVVVLLVVIIAGALLMWLHVEQQQQADRVLGMGMWSRAAWEEDSATFYLDGGAGKPAMVIYDYKNLLVSYRSQLHHACYITHMDKDNIPGLDTIAETFRRRQAEKKLPLLLTDRSLLGPTASILCSTIPIYWA